MTISQKKIQDNNQVPRQNIWHPIIDMTFHLFYQLRIMIQIDIHFNNHFKQFREYLKRTTVLIIRGLHLPWLSLVASLNQQKKSLPILLSQKRGKQIIIIRRPKVSDGLIWHKFSALCKIYCRGWNVQLNYKQPKIGIIKVTAKLPFFPPGVLAHKVEQ